MLVGDFRGSRFENNLYWSTGRGAILRQGPASYRTLQEWAAATGQEKAGDLILALFTDPRLALPAAGQPLPTDPRRLSAMPFYRLLPGSPCLAVRNGGCPWQRRSRLLPVAAPGGPAPIPRHRPGLTAGRRRARFIGHSLQAFPLPNQTI